MPYITKERRKSLNVNGWDTTFDIQNAGELNYMFTMLALSYLEDMGVRYQTYNDIIGALEGAKLEMYRRMVAPYEDTKKEENGDVY